MHDVNITSPLTQLQPSAQIQRLVKESVGEMVTVEDAEKLVDETDVNNAQ